MAGNAFADKSVIITGASRGIGRELALQLASYGARLTLAARNGELLAEVAGLCQGRGALAVYQVTDVSKQSDCLELVQKAADTYGGIDVLINNAGMAMFARFDALSGLEAASSLFDINFWGSVYCAYYALPYLKSAKGAIAVVNSGAGRFPLPGGSIYSASKHALTGFSDALRAELREEGVSVTTVYPDWVATGITGRAMGPDGKPLLRVHPCEQSAMRPDACASRILAALARRKREAYLSARQPIGLFFRCFAPGLADRLALREVSLRRP